MQLLNCASVKIEKLEIHDVVTFQDCSTCGSSGEDAVKSLCEFLGKCKNIEYVDFHGCYLKGKAMQSILSSLSKISTVSSIRILNNDSEICDSELVEMLEHLPRKCTFIFSSKKVDIAFKANEHDLEVSCSTHFCYGLKGYETFLTNIKCVFPQRFTGLSIEFDHTDVTVLEYLSHNPNLKMITLSLHSLPQDKVVIKTENSKVMILKLCKSLTSIKIKGHVQDYGDILELVAEGVRQNNTLLCMEIIVEHTIGQTMDYYTIGQTITGLILLLNSLKSTPVQKLLFQNILFDSVCTEAFIQLLSYNQNITDLAIKGSTYFTDSSCTSSSPNTWTFFRSLQMKSLTVLNINGNKLKADGTVALLDFLHLNPQLAVLKASNCELTDDLFTDTHYWKTSSLKELTLDSNYNISVEGWTNLFQSLRHNTSLIKLNCYIYIVFDIGDMLNETIISNKCIQYLAISKPVESNTESLARALIQNLTLKEIRYGNDDNLDDLKREIQKLKRDKNITISPDWNLKIREADYYYMNEKQKI